MFVCVYTSPPFFCCCCWVSQGTGKTPSSSAKIEGAPPPAKKTAKGKQRQKIEKPTWDDEIIGKFGTVHTNRAPVLTLWVAVLAHKRGFDWEVGKKRINHTLRYTLYVDLYLYNFLLVFVFLRGNFKSFCLLLREDYTVVTSRRSLFRLLIYVDTDRDSYGEIHCWSLCLLQREVDRSV